MKDSWAELLSRRDLAKLVRIAHGCLACNGLDGLTDVLYQLRAITGFDAVACTCLEPARLPASKYKIMRTIVHPCGRDLTHTRQFKWCYRFDGGIRDILQSMSPQARFNELDRKGDGRLNICIQDKADRCLTGGRIFGAYESYCNRWILLVFACSNGFKNPGGSSVMEIAAPHLIHAFRSLKPLCAARKYSLTKREYEIINWLRKGKTTWEIAKILGVSTSGVNFHIENIKRKLDAVNRTQAVAIAVGSGLIRI